MRLRSSQLVFLLLLACSLQVRHQSALRWMAGTVAGTSLRSPQTVETLPRPAVGEDAHGTAIDLRQLAPDARGAAAFKITWPVAHPAAASAAVVFHTGRRRA